MKRIWITKDKKHLKIKDMASSHIMNCINMLNKYHAHKLAEAYAMGDMINGEQALLHYEQGLEQIEEDGWEDLADLYIIAFEGELRKRGAKC